MKRSGLVELGVIEFVGEQTRRLDVVLLENPARSGEVEKGLLCLVGVGPRIRSAGPSIGGNLLSEVEVEDLTHVGPCGRGTQSVEGRRQLGASCLICDRLELGGQFLDKRIPTVAVVTAVRTQQVCVKLLGGQRGVVSGEPVFVGVARRDHVRTLFVGAGA